MKLRQLLISTLCLLSISLYSQDAHFSYYQFAPATINPALTGAFYGNIRATALMRGQWYNVNFPQQNGNNGFSTRTIFVDGNIPFGLKEGDWISAGINLLMEGNTAGAVDTRRGFSGFSVAYHLTMGKDKSTILTAGVKYGSYSLAFNNTGSATTPFTVSQGAEISEDADYQTAITGADDMNNITDNTNDFHLGFMLTTPVGKSSDLRIGLSSDHLLAPRLESNVNNMGGGMQPPIPNLQGAQIERRINAFVQLYTDLSNKITYNPSIVYQSMGAASNILLQNLFSYTHNPNSDIVFNFGLGVRLADNMDVPFYVGVDYKDWRVGLSFDTNVSGLTQATSNAGAYELGISKIFKWNKKAQVKPKFICPRL